MGLEDTLLRIDSLKQEWDLAQPLKPADEDRLWKKLRLEWNYNSNHIEGNTLTYGETELLLIFGQTTGNHTIREYEEMKAHDAAIQHIRELAKEPRVISEADIRSLNQLILKEPFWKPAITPAGQETRKQIIPGDYKTAPNNVRTATGEVFHFADPLETPAKMQALVGWLQEHVTKGDLHVGQLISKLHYDFVLIHPFDDGNGRVARLLVNYVLLHLGFPPIVIKSKDKRAYLAALNRADAGDLGAFTEYLAKEVVWALELGLTAARGESVEEPDDLDKEIAVFVKQHPTKAPSIAMRSDELISKRAADSWLPLVYATVEKLSPLPKMFQTSEIHLSAWPGGSADIDWTETVRLGDELTKLLAPRPDASDLARYRFIVSYNFSGFSSSGAAPFDFSGGFALIFKDSSYFFDDEYAQCMKGPFRYDRPISEPEISAISTVIARHIFEQIKSNAEG